MDLIKGNDYEFKIFRIKIGLIGLFPLAAKIRNYALVMNFTRRKITKSFRTVMAN